MFIYRLCCRGNDKFYIGQTVKTIEKRFKEHLWLLRNKRHWNNYLQNSWNKYNEDSFYIEEIEKCNSIEELNKQEKYWIKELKALEPKNFNKHEGGNKPPILKEHTEETRKKLVDASGKVVHQYDKDGNYIDTFYGLKEAGRQTNTSWQNISRVLRNEKNKIAGGFQWSLKKQSNLSSVQDSNVRRGKTLKKTLSSV